MLYVLILLARPLKKQQNQTTFYGLGTYETNSRDLSYLDKRRTIVFHILPAHWLSVHAP